MPHLPQPRLHRRRVRQPHDRPLFRLHRLPQNNRRRVRQPHDRPLFRLHRLPQNSNQQRHPPPPPPPPQPPPHHPLPNPHLRRPHQPLPLPGRRRHVHHRTLRSRLPRRPSHQIHPPLRPQTRQQRPPGPREGGVVS